MKFPIVTLGEIGEFRAGFGFPDKYQGKISGDLPFAKVGDISTVARNGEKYISTARNYVDQNELSNLKAKPLPVGSIVFAKIGEAIRQNFRAVTTVEMLIDNNTIGLVPNLLKVDINYLYHFMCTLDLYTYSGATTVPAIRKSVLETIEIPLPPLDEQKRIAAILDKADAIRRKRQRAIKLADKFLRSVFLEMFGDPVTNPKGWQIKKVGEVVDCIVPGRDKPKSFTGQIPWVTTNDLVHLKTTQQSKNDIGLSIAEINEVRAKIVPAHSVIMTCVGDLGVLSIVENEVVINQQLHAFLPNKNIDKYFLMYALYFQKRFMQTMASSTTVPYMNKTICNSIPIILPSIEKQNKFGEICKKLEVSQFISELSFSKTKLIFNSLSQRAFSGNL